MTTVKQTLAAIRAIDGMTARHTDGEYRVTYHINVYKNAPATKADRLESQENEAYYTTDPQDALATARAMSNRLNGRPA